MTEIASEARPSDPYGCIQETVSRYPGQLANILVDSLEILEKARRALVDSLEILKNVLQPLADNGGSNGPATAVQRTDPKAASLPSNRPRRVLRTAPALTYIQTHCATKLTLRKVATACNISPGQLSKIFKKEHGVSFKRFILNYRLDRSAEVLKQGSCVKQAACSSGFTDLSYFSREFRGRFKLTPTRFKEMHMMGRSPSV